MSQFQVKNRKGYTLVNKQKIYLSAHSKDYRYIEIITDDILKQVDCVVTYIEPTIIGNIPKSFDDGDQFIPKTNLKNPTSLNTGIL